MPCGLSKVITRRRLCRLSNANACQERANREEAEGGLSGRLPFLLLTPGEAGLPYYINVGREADSFWAGPLLWLYFGFAENCVAARFSNVVS